MSDYGAFLTSKRHYGEDSGFEPVWRPDFLYDFQAALDEWAIRRGRTAIFADCGLGKTPMQLVWAENVVRKTNGRVLIVTPLAVSHQTVREAEKFGVECRRSDDGRPAGKITVTNYERLEKFTADDYIGVVGDESSILKNYDGSRRAIVTEFMRMRPYRLLCTATAAPNDYVELGTTSEALGVMGHMDMLGRFFRNVDNETIGRVHGFRFKHRERQEAYTGKASFWRFKHHAEQPFWRWVCSWARALRKPSDLGYDDRAFTLPPLIERETIIKNTKALPGELFHRDAVGLHEQREERRLTLNERCEAAASAVQGDQSAVVWCHLNEEGDLLERLIPDAVQVSGGDPDDKKEDALRAFGNGAIRVLVTKPRIAGFGLNWQHCAHMTVFPSHSFEQYYQSVRRCWRFGQTRPVTVDVITTPGESAVLKNLQRKATAADKMFSELVAHMNDALRLDRAPAGTLAVERPTWL